MSADTVVRPLTTADIGAVAALSEACRFSWSVEHFEHAVTSDQHVHFGLFAGTQLVGYVIGLAIKPTVSIELIAIQPDLRGKGYGKKLIRHLLHHLLMQGYNKAELEVSATNAAAHFYERLGFVTFLVRKGYYRNGDDALLMEKNL